MKTVLLIGGTRFVGKAILDKLLNEKMRVVVYHRGNHKLHLNHPNLFEEFGDCRSPLNYHALFKKYRFDLIIHTVAYKPDDLISLFPDIKKYKTPIIVISTGQVYIVTVNNKIPFAEDVYDFPLLPAPQNDTDYIQWIYGLHKRDVEQLLDKWWEEYEIPSVSLRCPVIQGNYDYSYRLFSYIARILDSNQILLPFKGNSAISHLYVEDLTSALSLVAASDINNRAVFNLSMQERTSLSKFIKEISALFKKHTEIFELQSKEEKDINKMLSEASPYSGKWVSVLNNKLFKSKYKWKPTPLNEWLPGVARFQADNFKIEKLKNYGNRELENSLLKTKKEV
ncbi:MAG: NAD-dependent epimerase/dehydratase family protein, partial [Calditrichia bacterium]|nr:NAD-dependent epimerase/dehydratase family protein [Calditrichia bacterium]